MYQFIFSTSINYNILEMKYKYEIRTAPKMIQNKCTITCFSSSKPGNLQDRPSIHIKNSSSNYVYLCSESLGERFGKRSIAKPGIITWGFWYIYQPYIYRLSTQSAVVVFRQQNRENAFALRRCHVTNDKRTRETLAHPAAPRFCAVLW